MSAVEDEPEDQFYESEESLDGISDDSDIEFNPGLQNPQHYICSRHSTGSVATSVIGRFCRRRQILIDQLYQIQLSTDDEQPETVIVMLGELKEQLKDLHVDKTISELDSDPDHLDLVGMDGDSLDSWVCEFQSQISVELAK